MRWWLHRLLRQPLAAHAIALGAAAGVFIAFTPTMGIQLVLAALMATWLRASRLSAMLTVYITNPLSMGPIYSFTYWVGTHILGGPARGAQELERTLGAEEWVDGVVRLFKAGADLALPLWVGGIAVGLVLALPTYAVVLRLVLGHRMLRESKRMRRKLRVDETIREAKEARSRENVHPPSMKPRGKHPVWPKRSSQPARDTLMSESGEDHNQ